MKREGGILSAISLGTSLPFACQLVGGIYYCFKYINVSVYSTEVISLLFLSAGV
jgi:hypothetical protein